MLRVKKILKKGTRRKTMNDDKITFLKEKIISLKEKIKKEREYREGLIKERRILDDRRNEINKILNKEVEYDENYQESNE